MNRTWIAGCAVGDSIIALAATVAIRAQAGASLKSIRVPKPLDLSRYVRDEKTLIALGKALFWDLQVSSDSSVACATCHFHAGADHRQQNLGTKDFPFGHASMNAGLRLGSAGISRQVTARNAPSVINAVYNFRDFWDGRANNVFTGWTAFGDADPNAHVFADRNGTLTSERLRIENAGLASQAVAPALDDREMSDRGRTWPMLGKKMLAARPLARQTVARDDSVLGPYADPKGRGLAPEHTYLALIRASFQPEYWRSTMLVDGEFTQAEYNFALFFGLALQAYESTLISDDSRYDRYLDGDRQALTPLELSGLAMFRLRECTSCHVDPELTLATYSGVYGNAGYRGLGPDAGFFNTGVEPIANDPGFGGTDGFGNFLSATARSRPEMAKWMRGFFKTPSLRNVELTGPYFHTGSKSTLEQIVSFYTFAGDYTNTILNFWGPDPRETVAMPAFMKTFTDDRVRFERAPFDHPELCVSTGYVPGQAGKAVPQKAAPRSATGRWASIPAVGAKGNAVPLQTFEELLAGIGRDGSRAHTLSAACSIPAAIR